MCDQNIIKWFADLVKSNSEDFHNKAVIEVGAKDVNASVRPTVTNFGKPSSYIGVDISNGKGVDMIVPAEKLVEKFGENTFDVVISTEMLEHVFDWKIVIDNLKRILKEGGTMIITTRSYGSIYHGYPFDFWRYQPEDIKHIFEDFKIEYLHYDDENIGVWLKAKKPSGWQPSKLDYALYSMAVGKKSSVPKNITFSRKMLVTLQNSLYSLTSRNNSSFLEDTLGKPSFSKNITFSRKILLFLRKFGLIM
jgi:SAM-dependent methyltransferase